MKITITSESARKYFLISALVMISLAVYWQVFSHKFVNFDDEAYLLYLVSIYEKDLASAIASIATDIVNGNWHPLTVLSLYFDFLISKGSPAWFHGVNLTIHILNGILLFSVLNHFSLNRSTNFLVALLFLLHPVQVEAVAWVAERKGLLAAFFALLSVKSYLTYASRNNVSLLVVSVFFYLLSLMSKTSLIMLPILFLLLDWWPTKRINNRFELIGKIKEKSVFIVIAVVFSIVTVYAHGKSGALTSESVISLQDRLAHILLMYGQYLKQFIFPIDLSVFYPYKINYSLLKLFLSILVFASITIIGFKTVRKFPYLLFGWLWFVVMIFPVTGLVQTGGHGHADRYMYFPIIGLLITVIFLAEKVLKRLSARPAIVNIFATTLIVMVSMVTLITIMPWKNTYTLFFNALENTENNFVAHRNLSTAFLNDGIVKEGMIHYEKARSIRPDLLGLYDVVSYKLVAIKEYDLAVRVLNDGIQNGIRGGEVFRKIGQIELLNEQYNIAIENFIKANSIAPDLKGVHYGLAFAHYSLGNYDHALSNILLEFELDPQNAYARRLYADICEKLQDARACSR